MSRRRSREREQQQGSFSYHPSYGRHYDSYASRRQPPPYASSSYTSHPPSPSPPHYYHGGSFSSSATRDYHYPPPREAPHSPFAAVYGGGYPPSRGATGEYSYPRARQTAYTTTTTLPPTTASVVSTNSSSSSTTASSVPQATYSPTVFTSPYPPPPEEASPRSPSHIPCPTVVDPQRVPHHDDDDVQRMIVHWTAAMDARLEQLVHNHTTTCPWTAAATALRLPSFICQHRYGVLQSFRQQHGATKSTTTTTTASTGSSSRTTTKTVSPVPTRMSNNNTRQPTVPHTTAAVSVSADSFSHSTRKRKTPAPASQAAVLPLVRLPSVGRPKVVGSNIPPPAAALLAAIQKNNHTRDDKEEEVSPGKPAAKLPRTKPKKPTSIPPTKQQTPTPPTAIPNDHRVYRVFRQGDDADDACLGFLTLPSDATFATARDTIQDQLELEGNWGFYLPELGPVCRKQEGKLGRILEFVADEDDTTAGTRAKPIKLLIVDK